MNREDAIKKIRKCLALAASSSEAEAAAALRQAQALMREHQVDEEGMALATVVEVKAKALFQPILRFELILLNLVADAFGCEVLSAYRYEGTSPWDEKLVRGVRFIGVDAAPEIAAYAFEALGNQLVRARKAYMARQSKNCKPATKRARGDAFALGWVSAVSDLVQRFAMAEKQQAVIDAYMRKNHPNLGSAKPSERGKGRKVGDAMWHGSQAGKHATLHHGVPGFESPKLLGMAR